MKKSGILAILALVFVGLTSCDKGVTINGKKVELADGIYAKVATTKGDILFQFETEKAPMTSANFILLAEGKMPNVKEEYKNKPYFDGVTFHRVIKDFMIQSGDPLGTGMGEPGYMFPNEIDESLVHAKGVVSMANSGPNTNGSQFFITVAPVDFLNGNYSVFGKVLEGQEVADSISLVPAGAAGQDKPNEEVKINKVEIIRVGDTYKNWDALAAFEAGKKKFDEENTKAQEEAMVKAASQEADLKAKYPTAQTSESGLMYVIQEVGNGKKPENGATVMLNYAGYLVDGSLFDTNIKTIAETNGQFNPERPYEPMESVYGPDAPMIPGFKEGVAMLNVGGKATLIMPPSLAYGAQGAGGVIPPNAWLIFDVEIVSVK